MRNENTYTFELDEESHRNGDYYMAGNKSLGAAALAKNDEFYTRLTDIEKELRNYRKHFKGKIVLCNCDDPFESNFFKYFVLNFNRLGLQKLIATCYAGSPIAGTQLDLSDFIDMKGWSEEKPKAVPYKAVVTTVYDKTGDGGVDMFDVAELFRSGENQLSELKGDGDFRSKECIELLKECDIVVTNPPFSLFREYIGTLINYKKKFIIIGNQNATKYREIFPLIRENVIWLGNNTPPPKLFYVPNNENNRKNVTIDKEGNLVASFGNILWFTNLDLKKHHEDMILVKHFDKTYKRFDNYDAIIVDKVADIPCDYAGIMGVPITFLDKYNPEQFEIIGRTGDIEWAESECTFFSPPPKEQQEMYRKQNKTWRVQNGYYSTKDGIAHTIYDRIFIRNKHPEE